MFRRNRESHAEREQPRVAEHTFGSVVVRETLHPSDVEGIFRVQKLEVTQQDGTAYDLVEHELPENVAVFADLRKEPIYESLGVEVGRTDEDPSIIWYPESFYEDVVEEKIGDGFRIVDARYECFTRKGDIVGVLHEIGHIQLDRSMDKQERMRRQEYKLLDEPLKTPADTKEFTQAVLWNEAEAWIAGFRRERELARAGIIVEPDIESNAERVNIALEGMATYAERLFVQRRVRSAGAGTKHSEQLFRDQWRKLLEGDGSEIRKSLLRQLRAYPKGKHSG